MDANAEDKILHQIEKNLSNNINENLFATGRVYDEKRVPARIVASTENSLVAKEVQSELPDTVGEPWDNNSSMPQLSRAEYIRQAREACLRQMNSMQVMNKGMDLPVEENDILHPALSLKRRTKIEKQPQDTTQEDNSAQEAAAFRFLIIRTICAIVIFISIFMKDKFNFKIGDFSTQKVQELVMGKDNLMELEDLIVSLLK